MSEGGEGFLKIIARAGAFIAADMQSEIDAKAFIQPGRGIIAHATGWDANEVPRPRPTEDAFGRYVVLGRRGASAANCARGG